MSAPRIFTIPSSVPFLEALAEGLIARHLDPRDPASLATVTVLLPTRRAARSLGEHLLEHARVPALVLPQIRPLGDVDEEALLLTEDEGAQERFPKSGSRFSDKKRDQPSEDLPETMPPLRRRFLLMKLIQTWGRPLSAAQRFHLAAELERLIDKADTQGVGLDRLDEIVPEALSHHWTEVLAFLEIVARHWPAIEAAEGTIGPAKRRALLMEALRRDWARHPPEGPVIAAGSTGTIPATAALLGDIAKRTNGTVILPGLDQSLDEAAWSEVGPSHPQGAMKALLATMGFARDDVALWPYGRAAAPGLRTRILNEALRPWPATDSWREVTATLRAERADALHLYRLDAANQGEEAKAIALILRETLETPGQTGALITPDRRLARSVQAELKRWAIDVDDSAGVALSRSAAGIFLQLLARAAAEALTPVPLLALIQHPLMRLGSDSEKHGLDRILRGLRPAPGFAGLFERIEGRAWLHSFIERLQAALAPLLAIFEAKEPVAFARLLDAQLAAAEALAGAEHLWQGDAGEALSELLRDTLADGESLGLHPPSDYPNFLEALLAQQVIRPRFGQHPRLFIWGPLEARLQKADTLILGGLNEGVWPAEPAADPWMSRGMMAAAGLPPPEQRLGLTAHDFVQSAASGARVYLTRALKIDGAPAVASRWLVRLETLLGSLDLSTMPPEPWLAYARALDKPTEDTLPIESPQPMPPVDVRPRQLSVSEIRRWIRDPYAIYARHVLGLKVLDPLDAPADAALRGQIIHEICEIFASDAFDPAAEDALTRLLAKAGAVFDSHRVPHDIRAFWHARFEQTARWLLAGEIVRRAEGEEILAAEVKGALDIAAPGGTFTLTGRADRIDRRRDGTLIIADYKTGQAPTERQMSTGLEPQLPLEALMARKGAFGDIGAGRPSILRVIRLMGGAKPGELTDIQKADDLAGAAEQALLALIARYNDPDYPYRSRPVPQFLRHEGPYDHLARVKEWSAGEIDEEGV